MAEISERKINQKVEEGDTYEEPCRPPGKEHSNYDVTDTGDSSIRTPPAGLTTTYRRKEPQYLEMGYKMGNVSTPNGAFKSIHELLYNKNASSTVSTSTFFTLELLAVRPVHECICKLSFHVDCIVNPTDCQLSSNNVTSCAITKSAGQSFRQDCVTSAGYTQGFRVTECCTLLPGNLRCRMIMNAVCPTKSGVRDRTERSDLLYRTFVNCLNKADKQHFVSLALPSLSPEYVDSSKDFARLFVDAILEFSRTHPESERHLKIIYFAEVSSTELSSNDIREHLNVHMFDAFESLCNEAFATNTSRLFLPRRRLDDGDNCKTDDAKLVGEQELKACYRVSLGDAFSRFNPAVFDPETGNIKVFIYVHDILDVKTDVLLCPEDDLSKYGGRTAISIHQRFRKSMRDTKVEKLQKSGTLSTINFVVTKVLADEYPPKYIIHEQFPFWNPDDQACPDEFEKKLSESFYGFFRNYKKMKLEARSVAIPIIGLASIRHDPTSKCCNVIARIVKCICVTKDLRPPALKEIHIVCQSTDIAVQMDAYFQRELD